MHRSTGQEFVDGVGSGFTLGAMVGGALGFAKGFMIQTGPRAERFRMGVAYLKVGGGDYGNLFARFNGVVVMYKLGLRNYCKLDDLSSTFLSLPLAAATLSARQGVKYAIKNGISSAFFATFLFGYLAYQAISKNQL